MHLANGVQTDRRVLWLCWCGKYRAETDVVGAFALGGQRLGDIVRRFSYDYRAIHRGAHFCNRIVVLTDMNSLDHNANRDFSVIVNDQRNISRCGPFQQFLSNATQLIHRAIFPT